MPNNKMLKEQQDAIINSPHEMSEILVGKKNHKQRMNSENNT